MTKFKLNGKDIFALEGETIWQAAKRNRVDIPHLCQVILGGSNSKGFAKSIVEPVISVPIFVSIGWHLDSCLGPNFRFSQRAYQLIIIVTITNLVTSGEGKFSRIVG